MRGTDIWLLWSGVICDSVVYCDVISGVVMEYILACEVMSYIDNGVL